MSEKRQTELMAIITMNPQQVDTGNATVFKVDSEEMLQVISRELGLALRADLIRLSNGCMLVIKK